MAKNKKEQIAILLKGIETGDPTAVSVVDEAKYIQHNPQTHEGSEGLATLFKRLSETSPRVNIVRIFEDGDYVFAHTEYDFANRNIGFEIFRFENSRAVEHWDNIQKRQCPNRSAHTMVDGITEVTDHEKTETNRILIQSFVEVVLINQQIDRINDFINHLKYTEHNPHIDSLVELRDILSYSSTTNTAPILYKKCHRILAEGNFVLSVSEGIANEVPYSFFDLFRLDEGRIVEHWDTSEAIPTKEKWKNNNGKF
jgi:predicted SnoaL-like aldol condensation-catalyzing enzyme